MFLLLSVVVAFVIVVNCGGVDVGGGSAVFVDGCGCC